MNNKADILSNINTKIDDGGISTAQEVRDVLGLDNNSLLESTYSDGVVDNNLLETYTVKNSNFEYSFRIWKNANTITHSGSFTALTNVSGGSSSFVFNVSNSVISGNGRCLAKLNNSNDVINVVMSGNDFYITTSVLSGQTYSYSITYNSEN